MSEMIKSYKKYASVKRHGVRCEVNKPTAAYPLHRHDYFELELVRGGSVSHELNGVEVPLTVGDVIVLSPKDLHRFDAPHDVEICNVCIYYKDAPSALQRLLSRVQLPRVGCLSGEVLSSAIACFERASAALNAGGEFEREIIIAGMLSLLVEVFSATKPLCGVRQRSGFEHVAEAMAYIAANLTSPVTLEEVAAHVHLTPSYFSRLFAEISGNGFARYLAEQRVEHARMLLATTEMSITDVAFASGFGSFCAFSRAFRGQTGMTPREFKRHVSDT